MGQAGLNQSLPFRKSFSRKIKAFFVIKLCNIGTGGMRTLGFKKRSQSTIGFFFLRTFYLEQFADHTRPSRAYAILRLDSVMRMVPISPSSKTSVLLSPFSITISPNVGIPSEKLKV